MDIRIKINIVDELGDPFMGPGPLRLLERIREHRSINKAARDMSLSYVKALRMLNRLEQGLGQRLLIRRRGGNDRGGTELTAYAESYLAEYSRLEERMRLLSDREFQKFQKRTSGEE